MYRTELHRSGENNYVAVVREPDGQVLAHFTDERSADMCRAALNLEAERISRIFQQHLDECRAALASMRERLLGAGGDKA